MSWSQSIQRTFLTLAASTFHALQKTRELAYQRGLLKPYKARVPVISIGNLVTGGSGKTPLVIWLASRLRSLGMAPAVVSRGYGGSNRKEFLIVTDGNGEKPFYDAAVVGDEPYLIGCRLQNVPVLIGRKREHPVRAAADLFLCNVVILDDGFQHLSLERDLNVVVLTGAEDRMLPLIQLREPLTALHRADAFMAPDEGHAPLARWLPRDAPVFRFRHKPSTLVRNTFPFEAVDLTELRARKVMLVSAIARPDRFMATAKSLEWDVFSHVIFRDHHFFTSGELQRFLQDNKSSELVFTEKDWVKLPGWFQSHERTWALRIEAEVDDEGSLLQYVAECVSRATRKIAVNLP